MKDVKNYRRKPSYRTEIIESIVFVLFVIAAIAFYIVATV